VYEPLSSFDGPLAKQFGEAIVAGPIEHSAVGEYERLMWLRSQQGAQPILLPGELVDGEPSPSAVRDVLVLDPAEVPTDGASVGPGPLVCPLDLRARSAAALIGFIASATPVLRAAAFPESLDAVRDRTAAVLSDLPNGAVHVVSTTWTVPLPWFALVDPNHRHVVMAARGDSRRKVCWRVAMADARRRVARAHRLTESTFGNQGPTKVLQDTSRWLAHFHEHSAVELDYGGLVELLDDEELAEDSSAQDVNAIIEALEAEDVKEIATRFEKLRTFWGELAVRERFN
jgi:hypothetical protein